MKFFKGIRYSSLGVMASGIFVAIQGCDYREAVVGLLAFIALLLAGAGGSFTKEGIEVTSIKTSVDASNRFLSQRITFTARVNDPTSEASYDWTFGDGGTGSGQTVTHDYTSTGTFDILVNVKSSNDQQVFSTTISIEDLQVPFEFGNPAIGGGAALSLTDRACVDFNNPAPINGTVIEWQVFLRRDTQMQFKIVRLIAGNHEVVAESNIENGVVGLNVFSVNIPIQAGDFVGIWRQVNNSIARNSGFTNTFQCSLGNRAIGTNVNTFSFISGVGNGISVLARAI